MGYRKVSGGGIMYTCETFCYSYIRVPQTINLVRFLIYDNDNRFDWLAENISANAVKSRRPRCITANILSASQFRDG